ncbi:5'/3'-nucleotidase SurE [Roseiconus nitratireducens]|uniref:5'-nucleotidase SurE n=1 Tax=Roseiconus nitratireducens TaxID=2605748 RepID=A0A5M6DG28_9BACT|nr:5'/3'-nucleotidase SurE [Roseiconus nitratireducens]KAA5545159.1 5'/3'-nucleotidase SurE [Roseiconus nitratireducens]
MRILLTNDDGVFAPGLAALEQQLRHLGEVFVIAPATEQSGVSHSITYLTPLVGKSIHRDGRHWAWAVEGSPADCVKLAIAELLRDEPVDLVVSGINNGLNAGINVLYSGTVAAAIEGAFFGTTSVAVSLEYDPDADFQSAAVIAKKIVAGIARTADAKGKLFNLNIPTAATQSAAELQIVPMGLAQYGNRYEKRQDPGGRDYYWALWEEPAQPPPEQTDITELRKGNVTLSCLQFDMTNHGVTEKMRSWGLKI